MGNGVGAGGWHGHKAGLRRPAHSATPVLAAARTARSSSTRMQAAPHHPTTMLLPPLAAVQLHERLVLRQLCSNERQAVGGFGRLRALREGLVCGPALHRAERPPSTTDCRPLWRMRSPVGGPVWQGLRLVHPGSLPPVSELMRRCSQCAHNAAVATHLLPLPSHRDIDMSYDAYAAVTGLPPHRLKVSPPSASRQRPVHKPSTPDYHPPDTLGLHPLNASAPSFAGLLGVG